jgi:predicted nuclease of restriction endonuclease-like (RecB) superfamily
MMDPMVSIDVDRSMVVLHLRRWDRVVDALLRSCFVNGTHRDIRIHGGYLNRKSVMQNYRYIYSPWKNGNKKSSSNSTTGEKEAQDSKQKRPESLQR